MKLPKWFWLFIAIIPFVFLLLVVSVTAEVDSFNITTVYNSPTSYLIDYGENTITQVNNYTINSSTVLPADSSWLFLGSTNKKTITVLDTRDNIAFVADVEQTFHITTPSHYRYYYFVPVEGFANSATILNLTLYSNQTQTVASASQYAIYSTMGGTGGSGGVEGIGILAGVVGGFIGGILVYRVRRNEK